jgi:hypothetical protein
MSRIKVSQEVTCYDVETDDNRILNVNSNPNSNEYVVLEFAETKISVHGEDLITAVENAMSTGE